MLILLKKYSSLPVLLWKAHLAALLLHLLRIYVYNMLLQSKRRLVRYIQYSEEMWAFGWQKCKDCTLFPLFVMRLEISVYLNFTTLVKQHLGSILHCSFYYLTCSIGCSLWSLIYLVFLSPFLLQWHGSRFSSLSSEKQETGRTVSQVI